MSAFAKINLLKALIIDELSTAEEFVSVLNGRRAEIDELYRKSESCYNILIKRHLADNDTQFRRYFRLTPYLFDKVLGYVREDLTAVPTNAVPRPLPAEQKLCLTLRFLATGESFRSLSFQFRVSPSYVSKIVRETMEAIIKHLQSVLMPIPTEDDWKKIAEYNSSRWNFPNCIGAIDGKHVRIKCPGRSGSLYFNYKGFFSIVLMAICDGQMKFIAVDIGSYGREGDSGVFKKSNFGKQILQGGFNIPPPAEIPGSNVTTPYVFLADSAFPLHSNLMKPFSQAQAASDEDKSVFNYRLSRCRRTVENSFGILCQFFRIFHTPIAIAPSNVDKVVMGSCLLHNLLRSEGISMTGDDVEPAVSTVLVNIANNENDIPGGVEVRNRFMQYFKSERQAGNA